MAKNLKLDDLKVQSFVTSMNNEDTARIKGGGYTNYIKCTWSPLYCPGVKTCTDCGDASTC